MRAVGVFDLDGTLVDMMTIAPTLVAARWGVSSLYRPADLLEMLLR